MPTRNINLTNELDAYISERVDSGSYLNASEVVRAGLRALAQSEAEDQAKLLALRAMLAEAEKGPFMDGPTAVAAIRERLRLKEQKTA